MARMSPHAVGLASVVAAAGASVLDGPITADDLHTISSMARAEIGDVRWSVALPLLQARWGR